MRGAMVGVLELVIGVLELVVCIRAVGGVLGLW